MVEGTYDSQLQDSRRDEALNRAAEGRTTALKIEK